MMQRPAKREQTPQEFAKEHWKEILAISGTLAGAVILLLIRYHKKKRQEAGNPDNDLHLQALAGEAEVGHDETTVLLETGVAARNHIPNSEELAQQLSEGLPEELDHFARKRFKRRGNPKNSMQTLGRIK